MKKIFYFLMILGLSLSMVSCEKSDEGGAGNASKIFGTWQLEKFWEPDSGWVSVYDNDSYDRVIFNSGGTGKWIEYWDGEADEESFSWQISESTLMVKSEDESAWDACTITALTDKI